MLHWLREVVFVVIGLGVLVIGICLSDNDLRQQILAKRKTANLRARLHSVASTINVTVSTQSHDGSYGLYYTFPGGGTVSLVISDAGFNYFSPLPGVVSDIEGLSLLLAAVEREYQKEMADAI